MKNCNTLVTVTKDKSQGSNRRQNSFSLDPTDFYANDRRWLPCLSSTYSHGIFWKMEHNLSQHVSTERLTERWSEERKEYIVGRRPRRQPFKWDMRFDATQHVWQGAKTGHVRVEPASNHFIGTNRMFGHSAVLHKHHWSLNPPTATMSRLKHSIRPEKIYRCLCVGLPMYINRPLFTSETIGGACLSVSVHDYV